jgi:tripartite ATP-independent transporter DctM subunit
MYLVSGISGAKAADMAAIAPVLAPEMKRRGAKQGEIAALLASSGAMSETIPPSLVLITIGSVTGVSIGALFAAGIIPALLLAGCLGGVIYWKSRSDSLVDVRRPALRELGRAFVISLPALMLPFTIRAAVVEGVATATEVSTIGIIYATVVGLLVFRRFEWQRLYPMFVDTAALAGAILLIVGAATGMAWALTQSGFSQQLVRGMAQMPGGAVGFLAVSVVAFAILGSLLEGIPAIVLFGPLLFPAARALGINDVHYAIVVIVAMGLGLFAPPFGVGYYIACAIGRENAATSMRAVWVYLAALLFGLIILAAFPVITTAVL